MDNQPGPLPETNRVEPVPRRIRGYAGGRLVLDTLNARYVFENPYVPRFYIPAADVEPGLLRRDGERLDTERGAAVECALDIGSEQQPKAALMHLDDTVAGLKDTVRFDWQALDAWFEEDEQVFVHPRNPYVRVDALRSTRAVRVLAGDTVLAESPAPVMVFETGLPTRYYLDRTCVAFDHLRANDIRTQCPYKGRTSAGWDAVIGASTITNVAWSYDFPLAGLDPIKGLICFYNEKVSIIVDGENPPT